MGCDPDESDDLAVQRIAALVATPVMVSINANSLVVDENTRE